MSASPSDRKELVPRFELRSMILLHSTMKDNTLRDVERSTHLKISGYLSTGKSCEEIKQWRSDVEKLRFLDVRRRVSASPADSGYHNDYHAFTRVQYRQNISVRNTLKLFGKHRRCDTKWNRLYRLETLTLASFQSSFMLECFSTMLSLKWKWTRWHVPKDGAMRLGALTVGALESI